MQALLTETAAALLDRRATGVDDLEPVRVQEGGQLLVDGRAVAPEQARPEVAWATGDVFFRGRAEAFFGAVLASPSIRWFQSPAAGYLAVYDVLFERGVRVTGAHINAIPIAEYVLQAVLAHYQRAHEWTEARAAHAWRPHEFREVHGTTWLVFGVGAIGSAIARRAAAFGTRVLGIRRNPAGDEPVHEMHAPAALLQLLPACDVVVLAAPASSDTEGLVDDRFLDSMKAGSVLVNVARGALIEERALLGALDRGRPEAAILDTFATEPLPAGSPFWTHPRVVLTPHSSAGGLGRHARLADLFLENLGRYRRGEPLIHEVSPSESHAAPTWMDAQSPS